MKFYFAPMEGLTLYAFRQTHNSFFQGIDKYYTPFLVANQTLHFKKKEIREILPENNRDMNVVPQVLSNKAEEFLWAVRTIVGYGYKEINLNLGCPSPTVVTRGRGAGFLADTDRLDRFFDEVFNSLSLDPEIQKVSISVKTRTGLNDHAEAEALMEVYNRYPISELIIHPRRKTDLYKGSPDWDVFAAMKDVSAHPVCYNGDICSPEDYQKLIDSFPDLDAVMIGRGLIRDPSLVEMIQECERGTGANKTSQTAAYNKNEKLRKYLDTLFKEYSRVFSGENQTVSKMKEIWYYMGDMFPESEKSLKMIKKARTYEQYLAAVSSIL